MTTQPEEHIIYLRNLEISESLEKINESLLNIQAFISISLQNLNMICNSITSKGVTKLYDCLSMSDVNIRINGGKILCFMGIKNKRTQNMVMELGGKTVEEKIHMISIPELPGMSPPIGERISSDIIALTRENLRQMAFYKYSEVETPIDDKFPDPICTPVGFPVFAIQPISTHHSRKGSKSQGEKYPWGQDLAPFYKRIIKNNFFMSPYSVPLDPIKLDKRRYNKTMRERETEAVKLAELEKGFKNEGKKLEEEKGVYSTYHSGTGSPVVNNVSQKQISHLMDEFYARKKGTVDNNNALTRLEEHRDMDIEMENIKSKLSEKSIKFRKQALKNAKARKKLRSQSQVHTPQHSTKKVHYEVNGMPKSYKHSSDNRGNRNLENTSGGLPSSPSLHSNATSTLSNTQNTRNNKSKSRYQHTYSRSMDKVSFGRSAGRSREFDPASRRSSLFKDTDYIVRNPGQRAEIDITTEDIFHSNACLLQKEFVKAYRDIPRKFVKREEEGKQSRTQYKQKSDIIQSELLNCQQEGGSVLHRKIYCLQLSPSCISSHKWQNHLAKVRVGNYCSASTNLQRGKGILKASRFEENLADKAVNGSIEETSSVDEIIEESEDEINDPIFSKVVKHRNLNKKFDTNSNIDRMAKKTQAKYKESVKVPAEEEKLILDKELTTMEKSRLLGTIKRTSREQLINEYVDKLNQRRYGKELVFGMKMEDYDDILKGKYVQKQAEIQLQKRKEAEEKSGKGRRGRHHHEPLDEEFFPNAKYAYVPNTRLMLKE